METLSLPALFILSIVSFRTPRHRCSNPNCHRDCASSATAPPPPSRPCPRASAPQTNLARSLMHHAHTLIAAPPPMCHHDHAPRATAPLIATAPCASPCARTLKPRPLLATIVCPHSDRALARRAKGSHHHRHGFSSPPVCCLPPRLK